MMKLPSDNFCRLKNYFWLTSVLVCLATTATVDVVAMAKDRQSHQSYLLDVSTATVITNKGKCMNRDPKKIDLALEAAQKWLDLVDSSEYTASWSEAAPYFQNAIAAEQWSTTLQGVRQPLGKVISREVKSTQCTNSLPGAPDGEYVVMQYQTSFEQKKSAVETVTLMLERDGEWKVAGYFIK